MKFTKMEGCANDYIYVYTGTESVPDEQKSSLAIRLSDRHTGIGSDGLIFINPTDKADFEMEMYNSDGSLGAMCGNGIRCVGKYVYDRGLIDRTEFDILTGSGIKRITLKTENGIAVGATVNMGQPIREASKIPVVINGRDDLDPVVSVPLDINGTTYNITCVSMGNPHCVIFMDQDVKNLKIEDIGPFVEHHVIFPDRVNTEFVNVVDRRHLIMRVWERGAGETMACGTGACATAVAAVMNNLSDRRVKVALLGGDLDIEWRASDDNVYMTGPAKTVFEGEVEI